jgi:hypothetical protein
MILIVTHLDMGLWTISVQHFFTSIAKAETELDWAPEFSLVDGLTDSYNLDFGRGTFRKEADFSTDDVILEKLGTKTVVAA